jgi:hypothetical protein
VMTRNGLRGDTRTLQVRSHNGINRLRGQALRHCLRLEFSKRTQWNVCLARVASLGIVIGYSVTHEKKPHNDTPWFNCND